MEKVSLTLGFVVIVLLFTTTYAFTSPRQSVWPTRLNDLPLDSDAIVRQSRGLNITFPCDPYVACRNAQDSLLEPFLNLEFGNQRERFTNYCPTVSESNECPLQGCDLSPINVQRRIFYARLVRWVCNHEQQFLDGEACWQQPFKRRVRECIQSQPGIRRPDDDANACYLNIARNLTHCSEEDALFAHSFTSFTLESYNEFVADYHR